MAMTSFIVEIIVVGVFALIWVTIFVVRLSGLDIAVILDWFIQYKDWSTTITIFIMAIAYQLGWLVNQLGYFLGKKTFDKNIEKEVFTNQNESFHYIKTMVLAESSSFVVENIKERLSVIRLIRSALINFFFISFALFFIGRWELGIAGLTIVFILFLQEQNVYRRYCNQILNAYKIIKGKNEGTKRNSKNNCIFN